MDVCCVCEGVGKEGVEDVSAKLARVLEIEVTRSTQVNHPIPLCTDCGDGLNEFTRLWSLMNRAQMKIVNPILQWITFRDFSLNPIAIWKRTILQRWMEKYNEAQRLIILNGGEGEQISRLDLTNITVDLDLFNATSMNQTGEANDQNQAADISSISNQLRSITNAQETEIQAMETDTNSALVQPMIFDPVNNSTHLIEAGFEMNDISTISVSELDGVGSGDEEVTILGDEEILVDPHNQTTLPLSQTANQTHQNNGNRSGDGSPIASGIIAVQKRGRGNNAKSSNPWFICELCGRCFSKRSTFWMHKNINSRCKGVAEGNAKKCFCGQDFSHLDWMDLKFHIDKEHPNTILQKCRICNKEVLAENMMHGCRTSTDPVTDYHCDYCQRTYNNRQSLDTHLRIKHRDDSGKFPCQFCTQTFNSTSARDKHMHSAHNTTNPTPFQCSQCSVYLSNPFHLKVHLRMHAGEKIFVCEICQKKFIQQHHLSTHMATHSEVKKFSCGSCSKSYKLHGHLQSHRQLTHGIFKITKCPLCPHRRFLKPNHLKSHMESEHGGTPEEADILAKLDAIHGNKENEPQETPCPSSGRKRKRMPAKQYEDWSDSKSESESEGMELDDGESDGNESSDAGNEEVSFGVVRSKKSPEMWNIGSVATKSPDRVVTSANRNLRGRLVLVGSPVNY